MKEKITSLKKEAFGDALAVKFPIIHDGLYMGALIPAGPWVLSNNDISESMSKWRNRFKRMFPTQTATSAETTRIFLANLISSENSILFLIADEREKIIGHIAAINFDDKSFELAHLMRGEPTSNNRLVFFAEIRLIRWAFENSYIKQARVEAMSYNFPAVSLHEEVGFVFSKRLPLKKMVERSEVKHVVVNPELANVNYAVVEYTMNKADFYAANL